MKGTRGDEELGTGGRPGTREQRGIDNGGEDGDAGLLDGNDEGTLGGGGAEVQRGIGGRHEQADDEGTADVKDDESEPDALDGLGHGASGVGSLGGGDSSDLGTDEGEGGVDHDAEEGEKSTLGAWYTRILDESSRFLPVLEPDGLMVGPSAGADYNTQYDQADDRDDLDGRKPEFHLAIEPVATKIHGVDHNKHETHPHSIVADARCACTA